MFSKAALRKVFFFGVFVLAFAPEAKLVSEEPVKVTVCELKTDPAAYNHKLVQVTGVVSHGFEDFTLSDAACPAWPAVWLEYGGVTNSGTTYCCGVSAARKRSKQLVVEGISIPLVADRHFHEFDRLIQQRPVSITRATLIGRFFSGKKETTKDGNWNGFGHMGCCSLFVIQQVVSVAPQPRAR